MHLLHTTLFILKYHKKYIFYRINYSPSLNYLAELYTPVAGKEVALM